MKYFSIGVIVVVSALVVMGLVVVGSPATERMRRTDQTRMQNLDYIQNELIQYWSAKGNLPANLTMLDDELRGVKVPLDPANSIAYEYTRISTTSFRLCATFALPFEKPTVSYAEYGGIVGQSTWMHSAGRSCFDRVIDTDFFRRNVEAVNLPPKMVPVN